MVRRTTTSLLLLMALIAAAQMATMAQVRPPIDHYIGAGYPYELVSAKKADRIAWLAYERGQRNVYTAVAPSFVPIRLTRFLQDDGVDLTNLRVSDDGATIVFVRGHDANRDGWVANP